MKNIIAKISHFFDEMISEETIFTEPEQKEQIFVWGASIGSIALVA